MKKIAIGCDPNAAGLKENPAGDGKICGFRQNHPGHINGNNKLKNEFRENSC